MEYKGEKITPYESFYWNTTERFFRGQLGGGISRMVKTDNSLAVMGEVKIGAMRGRNPDNPSERGKSNGKYRQRLEINKNGTSNTITSVQKDNLVIEPQDTAKSICLNSKVNGEQPSVNDTDIGFKNPQRGRVYSAAGLSPCLNCCEGGGLEPKILSEQPRCRIRKLTPRECLRLMDCDDEIIDKIQGAGISNTQQYKLAGNSIVVNVLYHLFRKMFDDELSLF